jgi:hypothetical protein
MIVDLYISSFSFVNFSLMSFETVIRDIQIYHFPIFLIS